MAGPGWLLLSGIALSSNDWNTRYRRECADRVFVGNSTDVLTFKCGGSQHVNEVCGKTYAIRDGGFEFSAHSELECVITMLSELEERGIPAPGEFRRINIMP